MTFCNSFRVKKCNLMDVLSMVSTVLCSSINALRTTKLLSISLLSHVNKTSSGRTIPSCISGTCSFDAHSNVILQAKHQTFLHFAMDYSQLLCCCGTQCYTFASRSKTSLEFRRTDSSLHANLLQRISKTKALTECNHVGACSGPSVFLLSISVFWGLLQS